MDHEAGGFEVFVETRERALQRTAWLLTGDRALAEDLVQTALARTWPHWERIKRRDDPEVYVRRVMVNTWSTWRRRRWHREESVELVPDSAAPGDVAAEVVVRVAVRRALGMLTDRQRAVVVLRVFDDLSEGRSRRYSAARLERSKARCPRRWRNYAMWYGQRPAER